MKIGNPSPYQEFSNSINVPFAAKAKIAVALISLLSVLAAQASANVVLKVVDQQGQEIPGSLIDVLSQTVGTGDSLVLPEGEQFFSVLPGIQGLTGSSTLLYRSEVKAATSTTTELLFEWITSSLTARLRDQHGVEIPASQYNIPGPSINLNCGDPVMLPITDEIVYPTMNGGLKDGYGVGLIPGLEGDPGSGTELYRQEGPFELSAAPAEFVFEWITAPLTVRLRDQHGVEIPASRYHVTLASHILNAGDPVTLPITDESVYPTMNGFYKDGYFTAVAPGINGNPGNANFLYRYESNLELGSAPAEFEFEWIQHQCTIEVRNAANSPVPGSDLILPPLFPDFEPGQAVTIPINDAATYPAIGGYYASSSFGYWITVTPGDIVPTSSEIYFTLSASGEFSPGSLTISGNAYSLALGDCGDCEPADIESLSAPTAPLALGTTATVTAQFAVADSGSGRTCTFQWGDGTEDAGIDASGTICSAMHTYADAGVYRVTVTATNDCDATDVAVHEFIVVYDPEGGFVTGGGWINSPAGAYALDPALTGKANFGFVAKYGHGANVPTGNTEFQFKAGDLNFHGTAYDWLVVAGAKAKYKGSGTINGSGDYAFMLTATDGQASGGDGTDRFRIKIWDKSGGGVIYDNQPGDSDDAEATTALGGGSIVIHKP
ncbi:MAG: PKD domain-containing protein [Verrucomicrobiales bacterium]|nr:PKD domain-containing protein [Verrucomicrobiales bacterium]